MKVNSIQLFISSLMLLTMSFASPLSWASEPKFSLTSSENRLVGQGTYRLDNDNQAQITITFQGLSYTGTGMVKTVGQNRQQLQKLGMRSDRALLKSFGLRHKKSIESLLTAENGATLSCALNISGTHIGGQCEDSTKQMLEVKTSEDISS